MTETVTADFLNDVSFGLASVAGIGPSPTVTIELERKQAEALLWKITQELEMYLKDYLRPMPVINLGAVFQYRGVNFCIVERATP